MTRNRLQYIAAVLLTAIAMATPIALSAKSWETVRTERVEAKTVVRDSDIEIRTAPLTIFVTVNRNIQIKIFTILGRLVNSETLQPGTLKLVLPAHGVYIVKAGDLTCKVAV